MTKKYRFTIIVEGVPLEGSHLSDCIADLKLFTEEAIDGIDHFDEVKVVDVSYSEIINNPHIFRMTTRKCIYCKISAYDKEAGGECPGKVSVKAEKIK